MKMVAFTLYGDQEDLMLNLLSNEEVQQAYKSRGEEYVPLGIHGTYVGVDWDSCIADGACIEACPWTSISMV